MTNPHSSEELLQQMVGFDTVNASISGRPAAELPLAEYLETTARARGLKSQRLPVGNAGFNLLIAHEVNAESPWLLFESHLDTVSVDNMTIDPFAGRISGGKLYGRGACDTKGSGAAMLWAIYEHTRKSSRPNNVAVLFTVDEEIGKTGIKSFVENDLDKLEWRPAGVITGEPTALIPVVAHNGIVRWTIRTKGVSAHSADPDRGQSAISMMIKVVHELESRYIPSLQASHPLTGKAQCSVNMIRGGTQINIIPEACEIHVDRRIVPGEDATDVLPAIERPLDELRRTNADLEVTQDEPFIDPPLDPSGNEGFISFVKSSLRELGMCDDVAGAGYATNASTISDVGIPAIVMGPGDIAQAHTADEWISLDQLHGAVEVYLKLMCTSMDEVTRP